jgi:hypothetical protein
MNFAENYFLAKSAKFAKLRDYAARNFARAPFKGRGAKFAKSGRKTLRKGTSRAFQAVTPSGDPRKKRIETMT